MNAEYMNRWQGERSAAEVVRDGEARQLQELFERELVLPANDTRYEVLYALGEIDS